VKQLNLKALVPVLFIVGTLLLLGCTQKPTGEAFKISAEKETGLPLKKCTPKKWCKNQFTLAKRYSDCTVTTRTCTDICCNGGCTTSVCDTNSDCDDQNAMTKDTCQNPGTCEAYCSNELNFSPTAWIESIPTCSKPNEVFSVEWRAYDSDGVIQSVAMSSDQNCTLWDGNTTGIGTQFASGTKRYSCPAKANLYSVMFTLTAWDDDWAPGSDTNSITIDANCTTCIPEPEICGNGVDEDCDGVDKVCVPPVANAGGDYNGTTTTTLLIIGTGTDTDGYLVDLNWTIDGNCTVVDQNWTGVGTSYAVTQAQLWCPQTGTFWIQLLARDNDGLTDTDWASVNIR
jgi:hypothetical protein